MLSFFRAKNRLFSLLAKAMPGPVIDKIINNNFALSPFLVNSAMTPNVQKNMLIQNIHSFPKLVLELHRFANFSFSMKTEGLNTAHPDSEKYKKVFNQFGSDKSSNHNYHKLYAELLSGRQVTNLLEVGIGSTNPNIPSNMGSDSIFKKGGSLRSWQHIFSDAKIFGADIDRDCLFQEDRISTYYVDQLNPESLSHLRQEIGQHGVFQVIIDDGLHSLEANLRTLMALTPLLDLQGIYIIEDISPAAKDVYLFLGDLLGNIFTCRLFDDDTALIFTCERKA
jgi:hypothetical protein